MEFGLKFKNMCLKFPNLISSLNINLKFLTESPLSAMKTKFTIALYLFIATMSIKAQTDPILDAFTKSHYFEKFVNYTSAIDALKPVYSADSYEINLRLGWLCYKVGLAKESMEYYEKSLRIREKLEDGG